MDGSSDKNQFWSAHCDRGPVKTKDKAGKERWKLASTRQTERRTNRESETERQTGRQTDRQKQ